MAEICLYENARLGVRYVYDRPVKFSSDPEVIAKREADKARIVERQRKEA